MRAKNILVLTFWSYRDALIQTYTLPYVRIIRYTLPPPAKVFLQTLEQPVHRMEKAEKSRAAASLAGEGINWITVPYFPFGARAMAVWALAIVRLFWLCRVQRITHIHCWCTPAGSVGYVLSLLTGAALVLDSYEPHADAMVESGTWKRGGFAHRLLHWFEKRQSHRASSAIGVNGEMKEYAARQFGAAINSFFAKPACVDLDHFSLKHKKNPELLKRFGFEDKLVCVYAGKFGGIYLEEETFRFFRIAAAHWGSRFRALLLTRHEPAEITVMASRAGVDPSILVITYAEHSNIPAYMGLADFAITPIKPIPSKKYSTPVKDGEYWALGLPVIITAGISDDSEIIERNETGVVLKDYSDGELLAACRKIDRILSEPHGMLAARIRSVAEKHRSFDVAEKIYREIYG